jgi:hypothetical protein
VRDWSKYVTLWGTKMDIYIHTYREYDPAKMSILPGNYNDMIQAILNAGGLLFQDVKAA